MPNNHRESLSQRSALSVRDCAGASGISELAPSMLVLLLVVFPAINLIGLACGAATLCLTARQCVTRASTAHSVDDALSVMKDESRALVDSGLGQFSRLQPIQGYNGSGADFCIKQTNIYTSVVTQHALNQGIPPPVDTASSVYEGSVRVRFLVGPLVNLSVIPGLGDVPSLGKPAELTMTWDRALEHPELFAQGGALASGTAGGFSGGSASGTGTGSGTSVLGAWNYPTGGGGWQPMPGQVILQVEDIQVSANSEPWLQTDVTVQQGNRLTFDFISIGNWSAGAATVDADGESGMVDGAGVPRASLVGQVGNGPRFFIGKDQWNFTPPSTGKLKLQFNDWDDGTCTTTWTDSDGTQRSSTRSPWEDNSGIQKVKIYRTN